MRKDIYEIDYQSKLSLMETQKAIKFVKDTFQHELVKKLKLLRVSAPLFVLSNTGLNDNLSGKEKPVSFMLNFLDQEVEIVHSLAKWKRMALGKYGFEVNTGLYTDMNAIRKDEELDFIHSLYVDQWDWERVILKKDRTYSYLKKIVKQIYSVIYNLERKVSKKYPVLSSKLPKDIHFISTKQLEELYPNLSRKEREDEIARKYKAVFLYQIGYNLKDGMPHDSRAADYDDWKLNGDILVYYPLYDMALELSSMGIRVDAKSLIEQLKHKGELNKLSNEYCSSILNENIPLSIGGGIGQSRIFMLMLGKEHIAEVQASTWEEKTYQELEGLKILFGEEYEIQNFGKANDEFIENMRTGKYMCAVAGSHVDIDSDDEIETGYYGLDANGNKIPIYKKYDILFSRSTSSASLSTGNEPRVICMGISLV